MKIAHIGSRGFPGFQAGVEKSLEEICPRLAARGHEVTLYCSDHVTTAEPVFKHTILKRMPSVPTKHFETLSRVTVSAWDALFQNYDIVHFHSIGPALMSWLTRPARCKTVVTVHGLDWQRAKWGWAARKALQMGEKCSVLFPDHTIVVSKYLKRYYKETYQRDVSYIPNGVNVEAPVEAKEIHKKWPIEPKRYVLFASRLVPEKACHHLIEAFRKTHTKMKLVIAGASWHSDDYVKELHEMAKWDKRIVFAGWVEGDLMKELYSNAYLFCLPSEIEGLSLALLDAMGHGLCPLTSDIPENIDVVEKYGVTFKKGDVADLQKRLEELIANPERAVELGQAARRHVQKEYSWDHDCELLERTYKKILNEN